MSDALIKIMILILGMGIVFYAPGNYANGGKEGGYMKNLDRVYSAIREDNTILVKELLDNGSILATMADDNGATFLHEAARWGSINVVNLLINTYHLEIEARDYAGDTPMHVAASLGGEVQLQVIARLAALGANINARNDSDSTPRDLFAFNFGEDAEQMKLWRRYIGSGASDIVLENESESFFEHTNQSVHTITSIPQGLVLPFIDIATLIGFGSK